MTDAERKLWSRLRRNQVSGVRFYRQKPLAGYIVDFYAARARLGVEVDGGQHWEDAHRNKDEARDAALAGMELRVLRFSNREVLEQTDAVMEVIRNAVEEVEE